MLDARLIGGSSARREEAGLNYYPYHIGDFRSGTVNMSRRARWIYRDMLDVYYDTERPLPLDLDSLCAVLGVESDDERAIVERLLRFKFEKTDDGYRNEVCDRVIADYHQKAETARTNGGRGGRKRNRSATEPEPTGFRSGSDPQPSSVPGSTPDGRRSEANQEPRTNISTPDGVDKRELRFDAFRYLTEQCEVSDQTAKDWIKHRKEKKAAPTKTAIDGIMREAVKARMTLDAALAMACERGWQGFKASWVNEGTTAPPRSGRADAISNYAAAAAAARGEGNAQSGGGNVIDGSAERID